jgi:Neurotransmitter-gated ion-channel ligand binding domain
MRAPQARRTARRSRGVALILLGLVLCCAALVAFPRPSRGQQAQVDLAPSLAPAGASASATAAAGARSPASVGTAAASPAPSSEEKTPGTDLLSLPIGGGLPLIVRLGVFFLDLKSFDDTKGEAECTVDVRATWRDSRLSFPKEEALRGYKELRGSQAEAFLEQHWKPQLEFANRVEVSEKVGRRVRLFADGTVESMERRTGKYTVHVDPERFPFDRQHINVVLNVVEDTTDAVILGFDKEEVEFSRVARTAALGGWHLGLVDLRSATIAGWNGDRYSQVTASLFVDRKAETGVAPIFIPLIASLLIPLLAIWMNKSTEDGFQIEAFELANISVGGLFSVIALSFAIYSSYGVIAGNDNTVTRLFALNYATLAISLIVVIFFYRFGLPRRLFGRYVEQQLFSFVSWALPVLTLGTSIAFLLAAAS